MATNKTFSPKRFCHLIYNDLLINYKAYILYPVSIGIVMYLLLCWFMYITMHFTIANYVGFMVLFGIVLGVIIGNAFPDFNNKIKAANYLLLPASALEKFLSQFFIRVVLATAIFVAMYWLDTYLARYCIVGTDKAIMAKALMGRTVIEEFSYSEAFSKFTPTGDRIFVYFTIFSLMSFMFAMRLFFTYYAVVKTLFSLLILIAVFTLVFLLYASIFYFFSSEEILWEKTMIIKGYKICHDLSNIELYSRCVAYISWIFFLLTGYYKIKEKQI